MTEIAPLPSHPDYGVTRDGRVFRIKKSRFGRAVPYELKSWLNKKSGYLYVGGGLSKIGTRPVHRLVAETFLPNPKMHGDVAHNDGVRTNNNVGNLRWDTRSGNLADKVAHGTHNRGERSPLAKLSNADVVAIRAARCTGQDLADRFGVSRDHIYAIRSGGTRVHG